MADQDDQDWIELLAGRPAPNAGAGTIKEAQAVRTCVLATRDAPAAAEFDLEAGLQRLLFRLRGERLLDGKPRRMPFYFGLALAASLLLSVGVIVFQQPDILMPDDQAVFRGGSGAAQTLTDADPARLAAQMKADLEAAGLKPQLVQFGDAITITADWPAEPDGAQLAFLRKHKLKRPADAQLRIEIRPAAR